MATRPHAFVAMPFGTKPAPGNPVDRNPDAKVELIDFNRVYTSTSHRRWNWLDSSRFVPIRRCAPATSSPTCSRSCSSPTWWWRT